MTSIELRHITKHYSGNLQPAINDFSLRVASGEMIALLGASGSGKTSLLKIIAGFMDADSGDLLFDGQNVLGLPTDKREAVMVFQNHLLFPHMSIAENIGFGLKMRGIPAKVLEKRVEEMLELIQLQGFGKRRPYQLSAGQQQRVALARALIIQPRVLLLDEPLSNLDVHLRDEMRELIRMIQSEFKISTILVTHDREDAIALAEKIALMQAGKLLQFASPEAMIRQPETEAVARFFGGVNFFQGDYDGQFFNTEFGRFQILESAPSGKYSLTIRPEHIQIREQAANNSVCALIEESLFMGTYWQLRLKLVDNEARVTVHINHIKVNVGDSVWLFFPPEHLWLIPW